MKTWSCWRSASKSVLNFFTCWWGCKMVQPLWKNSLWVPQMANHSPCNLPLGKTPNRNEHLCPHGNWCTNIRNSPKVKTTQMSTTWQMCDICTMEHRSVIKRNEVLTNTCYDWMNLEKIIWNEKKNASYKRPRIL